MRTIKLTIRDLKKILREEILFEEDKKATEESGEDSIDAQIDRYLSDFESEAKSIKQEGRDWNRTLRRLFEAEGDEEEGGEEEETEEDDSAEGEEENEIPQGKLDDIDMSSFVNAVIRLIDNYDSLLEIRNTILRRASNFLNKNYKSEVVDEFNNQLSVDHGMEIGKSDNEFDSERFIAPISDRSGGGGGSA